MGALKDVLVDVAEIVVACGAPLLLGGGVTGFATPARRVRLGSGPNVGGVVGGLLVVV